MKIAISLPKEDFLFLEKLRHRFKTARSKLIQQALEYWSESYKQNRLISRYENGYRRKPEKLAHIRSIERAQYEALSREGWR